jgi:hypothetical protein
VIRCSGMAMSTGQEAASERGKGGDNANWADTDLTELKNDETYVS